MLTLINFLLFLINVFIKIISRVIVFGILALSSFFIFFVIMVIVSSLMESRAYLGKSKDIFIFIHSIFMIITIMGVYLIFNHFKPFLAKIIKTMKIELNTKINIRNIVQKKEQRYENEIINDKSLSNLLIWLFSGIISFGIYEYLVNIYIYNLYVAIFVYFLVVGFWSIAFQKEGW